MLQITNTLSLQDKTIVALREAYVKAGTLKLSQLKRVKQLGTGDVGLVDLVELTSDGSRCLHPLGLTPCKCNHCL